MKYKPDFKIAVGTIYHKKADELNRLLHSFSHFGVDYWLLVGGAFLDSPDQESYDSRTENVIEHFKEDQEEYGSKGIQVINHVMYNCNEFQKRQKYIDMARNVEANALLIVDTDEYAYENPEWNFELNWEKFRRFFYSYLERYPGHSVYSLRIIVNEYLHSDFYARCWGYPELMTYVQGSHYKFGNPEQEDVLDTMFTHQTPWGVIEGLTLKHDHTLRTDEDMKNRRGYQDYLVKYEQFLQRPDLTDGDPEQARLLALREVVPFTDGCLCMKCFEMKKYPIERIPDPRPRDKREKNPYITGIPL